MKGFQEKCEKPPFSESLHYFLVRRMLIRKNLEFSPRSSVRSSIRSFRTFSKTVHYFFLKLGSYLELRKAEKIFQALF